MRNARIYTTIDGIKTALNIKTSGQCVVMDDNQTLQEKFNNGSLKGDKGDKGDTGATGQKGDNGSAGARGSIWNVGTAITGTNTTPTIFSSSGLSPLAGDMYLNTSTSNVYKCITGGAPTVATWSYIMCIKGQDSNFTIEVE